MAMNIELERLPRWALVALIARAARHVQGVFAGDTVPLADKLAINNAIRVAEASAAGLSPSGDAIAARGAAEAVTTNSEGQRLAAQCAANAATSCNLSGGELVALAETTLRMVQECAAVSGGNYHLHLAEDVQKAAESGYDLPEGSSIPSQMLNFVSQQCVHEAGHAVAAVILGLPLRRITLIYQPAIDAGEPLETTNPPKISDDLDSKEKEAFRLLFAAGMAGETLFNVDRKWASETDILYHAAFGAFPFQDDVQTVCDFPKFTREAVAEVAALFERAATGDEIFSTSPDRWSVPEADVMDILKRHDIHEDYLMWRT